MEQYLWDLDLKKIPLGWQKTYQKALIECPDGKIVFFDKPNSNSRFFYDPVQYHDKTLLLFNQNKQKAILLMSEFRTSKFKHSINELFKVDLSLFNLLSHWITSDDELFEHSFNPKEIENEILDTQNYFEDSPDDFEYKTGIEKYSHLKLLNIFK